MGWNSEKEARIPGLLGLVPVLRVGSTAEVASERAAGRTPAPLSARGPRPAAPPAPRTLRAAGITGGGGRGDAGGLGVFRRPGG